MKCKLSEYNECASVFLLQVELKPLREATVSVPAPKITEKRKTEDADASKDLKKVSLSITFASGRANTSRICPIVLIRSILIHR